MNRPITYEELAERQILDERGEDPFTVIIRLKKQIASMSREIEYYQKIIKDLKIETTFERR